MVNEQSFRFNVLSLVLPQSFYWEDLAMHWVTRFEDCQFSWKDTSLQSTAFLLFHTTITLCSIPRKFAIYFNVVFFTNGPYA